MPWDTPFLFELIKPRIYPQWLLEDVDSEFTLGGSVRLSSHRRSGYNECLMVEGNSISPARIDTNSWTATTSECSLAIRTVIDLRTILPRGRLLALRMGFHGWDVEDFETIFLGHAQSFDRSGDRWTLTIRSITASLISRFTTEPLFATLFSSVPDALVFSANYLTGGGTGPGSIVFTSDAGVERETGGLYFFQVFPDSGDPFFLSATTSDGLGGFTGVSTTGLLGTTVSDVLAGGIALSIAGIDGNPVTILRKILTSSEAGGNGPYDVLPETWGLGLPVELLDADDCDTTEAFVGVSLDWIAYSTDSQEDAIAYLQGIAAPAGLVLVERQGMITIRGASASFDAQYQTFTITNRELQSIDFEETWAGDQPVEMAQLVVNAVTGVAFPPTNVEEPLNSRPVSVGRIVSLPYVNTDPTEWEESIRDRISPWALRLAQVVEVRIAGLRLAQASAFDSLIIDSPLFTARDGDDLPTMMILSVRVDWWRGNVTIVAALTPASDTEF